MKTRNPRLDEELKQMQKEMDMLAREQLGYDADDIDVRMLADEIRTIRGLGDEC